MSLEFRPPVKRSKVAVVLGVIFAALSLVGALLLGAIAAGSSQVSYALAGGTLVVDSGSFLDGKRTFPVANVTDARVIDVSGARRTRGTGAPGMCTGQWSYIQTGPVWQATSCSPHVVMLTVAGEDRPILVTPPDPEGFVAQLRTGPDATIVLPPGDATLLRVVPSVGALVLLVASVMVFMVFLQGPRRMRYVIDGGRLTIATIFSTRSFEAVDLRARKHVPGVTLRLAGTAFPGYYTGLFRADGATTRIYATQLRAEGVLLEGPARVFLSPEDPNAFLEALAHAGASVSR